MLLITITIIIPLGIFTFIREATSIIGTRAGVGIQAETCHGTTIFTGSTTNICACKAGNRGPDAKKNTAVLLIITKTAATAVTDGTATTIDAQHRINIKRS